MLLQDLYDLKSDHDLPLTRADAMSVPAYARARSVLCTTVGRLPLVEMQGRRPVERPQLWIEQPERGRPRFITMSWIVDALMAWGRAWLVVVERYAEAPQRPARFEWVPEWNAVLSTTGDLIGHTDGRRFDAGDVVRIDGPHEGVLNYGSRELRGALRLARAALRAADNPVPSIDLHQVDDSKLTDDEIDALIARWVRARRGENGGVAYTNKSIEAKVLGQAVEQLLIEGRKQAALDIARLVGVPAWVVDVGIEGSSLTYSNTPSRSRELVDYGVTAYTEAIAGRLSMDDILPRGRWVRFDTNELLRADFAGRMAAYKVAKEAGVYTAEELRAMELGIPLEGESL